MRALRRFLQEYTGRLLSQKDLALARAGFEEVTPDDALEDLRDGSYYGSNIKFRRLLMFGEVPVVEESKYEELFDKDLPVRTYHDKHVQISFYTADGKLKERHRLNPVHKNSCVKHDEVEVFDPPGSLRGRKVEHGTYRLDNLVLGDGLVLNGRILNRFILRKK